MADKSFEFELEGRTLTVEADSEGVSRYMVRMSEKGRFTRVRVGYLTGTNRHWLIEFFGGRKSEPHPSAKSACLAVAKWALTQPMLQ